MVQRTPSVSRSGVFVNVKVVLAWFINSSAPDMDMDTAEYPSTYQRYA